MLTDLAMEMEVQAVKEKKKHTPPLLALQAYECVSFLNMPSKIHPAKRKKDDVFDQKTVRISFKASQLRSIRDRIRLNTWSKIILVVLTVFVTLSTPFIAMV